MRDRDIKDMTAVIMYVCLILFMFIMIFHVKDVNKRLTKIELNQNKDESK